MSDPKKPDPDAFAAPLHATRERLLPPLSATPRVVISRVEIAELELSDGARRAIPHLDGTRTVHELLEVVTGGDNLFDVLDELAHEGVIELSRK